ncbi:Mth938-like domain-containing protein [Roseateles koreensis]|uniref:Mth938-like domain-containing protein n=1 Tax=Roseateles koreensis TaxID=2987526 RepID=A0ABT5KMX0_9BURK|nr:Mth938-like domain-containing protein [Roseateles koreensis]MDC8783755.1 Mth938-like domain-containing protein [Roseateles koreensis]
MGWLDGPNLRRNTVRKRRGFNNAAPQNIQFKHRDCLYPDSAASSSQHPHMKFQLDEPQGGNSISRHDGQSIWVNNSQHTHSLLVPWQGEVQPWPLDHFESLANSHFEQILSLQPELVIFGSGSRIRFAHPALYQCLIQQRIGVETMDLAAACRTYNVLASEGRAVLAALLIEP